MTEGYLRPYHSQYALFNTAKKKTGNLVLLKKVKIEMYWQKKSTVIIHLHGTYHLIPDKVKV